MTILITASLLVLYSFHGIQAGSLFSPIAVSRENLACCNEDHILSCQPLKLNSSALGDDTLELAPLNATLKFEGMAGGNSHSFHYATEDIEAVMTYHAEKDDLFGHVSTSDGKSFTIEYCGNGVHAMKELDVDNLGENKAVDMVDEGSADERILPVDLDRADDTTTIVTYSIKVYYTQAFADITSDIPGFVDQVITETNQGYINSKVPLRAKLHCIEKATINENGDAGVMLSNFKSMKGTPKALRGSADAAAILVKSFDSCGIGYFNTIRSGNTVTATAKGCALGYYSFGHELGHNIGLTHNPESSNNYAYSDGHGHLIAQGSASQGYRTILAYNAPNHRTRVNYYSNPDVNYPKTGTPTGVTGKSNNARLLTANRFALAAVGDESESCDGTTTPTTTPAPVQTCAEKDIRRRFVHVRQSGSFAGSNGKQSCMDKCRQTKDCVGWVHLNHACYLKQARLIQEKGTVSGPDPNNPSCSLMRDACEKANTILYVWNYSTRRSSSSTDCESACKNSISCSYWKWSNNNCNLYKHLWYRASPFVSGPKYC